ncbi:YdeI/OmpD-associated family protein [Candidatus Saccharibacteria bacterium]|nr:YdeI/OmpD-associated family protein [Candidatus Saccharibacteria bacterium]
MAQALLEGTVHKLPADFRKAILSSPKVEKLWQDITPLARNEWICWVEDAKKEETRNRRIEVGLSKMYGGMRRPCCWAGCLHRERNGLS